MVDLLSKRTVGRLPYLRTLLLPDKSVAHQLTDVNVTTDIQVQRPPGDETSVAPRQSRVGATPDRGIALTLINGACLVA